MINGNNLMSQRSLSQSGVINPGVDNNLYSPAKIKQACFFRSSAKGHMRFTAPSGGNRRKWTFSALFQRNSISSFQQILFSYNGTGSETTFGGIFMLDTNKLTVALYSSYFGRFSHLFNSTSTWYHIIWSVDTTQAVANDRVKLWVNGVESAKEANISLAQNGEYSVCNAGSHAIGSRQTFDANYPVDAKFAKAMLLDGKCVQDGSLTTGHFGYFDHQGNWRVRRDSSLALLASEGGPCSFFLPYTDGTSLTTLAKDGSTKGNNFTTYNMVADGSANDCRIAININ